MKAMFAWPRTMSAWTESVYLWNCGLLNSTANFGDLLEKTLETWVTNQTPQRTIDSLRKTDASALVKEWMGMEGMLSDAWFGAADSMMDHFGRQTSAYLQAVATGDPEKVAEFFEEQRRILNMVVNEKPLARKAIKDEMGMHFERQNEYIVVAETPRASLYQVLSLKAGVRVNPKGKPVLFISPFILKDIIQALLPYEGISLVHAFANKGAPTFIVHYKDIMETAAVQTMKIEDVIDDIAYFSQKLVGMYRREITLVGTCQGGAVALAACLSGHLKGLVDSLLQVVPANDLSLSPEWRKFLGTIPECQRDMENIVVVLPNGNKVLLGQAASLAMRLKGFRVTNPVSSFVSELHGAEKRGLDKQGLAVEGWLREIVPLPYYLAKFSEAGSNIPIADDPRGKMPYQLWGQDVYLADLFESGVRFYHAVGGNMDDVCSPEVVKAPFEHPALKGNPNATYFFVKGGHIAPMTSDVKKGGTYAEGGAYYMYEKFAEATDPAKYDEL